MPTRVSEAGPGHYPGGKRFAFTVVDDTDVATVVNVRPIYELLHSLGMRTTKTVWSVGCPEGSANYSSSQTLEDPEYLDFVLGLRQKGFEITWHGPTMESSERPRIEAGLERYREVLGEYPRIHLNHAENRDNLYWDADRIDDPILRRMMRSVTRVPPSFYGGHVEGSPFWWGDLSTRYMEYGRNLTCAGINTLRFNPSMPYRDPKRPLIRWWFSASDADTVTEFNELIHPSRQEQLEREQGVCIVATHFGKGFVTDGKVDPITRERLESLARRSGWFPTVGELLDWLREQRREELLPQAEWRRMQWSWALGLAHQKWAKLRQRKLITRETNRV